MIDEPHNQEVEVLRALAVVLVVVSHAGPLMGPGAAPAYEWIGSRYTFWTGVDLFFCISGYVIARSLLPRLEGLAGAPFWSEVVAFWIRRWYRLAPSAWAWIAIVLALTAVFKGPQAFGHLQSNFNHALPALLNIANFHVQGCVQADTSCQGSLLTVYWSLSLEEQFYLLLPLAVAFAGRRLGIFCLGLVLLQFFIDRSDPASLLWFIRTDAILLGVLLGIARTSPLWHAFEPTGFRRATLRWPVVALLVVALGAIPAARTVTFGVGFAALSSAALVFLAAFNRGYLIGEGHLRNALAWLGSRSYAIYLIHGTAFVLAKLMGERLVQVYAGEVFDTSLLRGVAAVTILLALSELNYRFLERPMRLRGRAIAAAYLARRAATAPSSALSP